MKNIKDFNDLNEKIHSNLEALDIFDSINVSLAPTNPDDIGKNLDDPLDCTLTVTLKEKKRLSVSTSVVTSGKEGAGMETKISLLNYFGKAERLNYNYSVSNDSSVYKFTYMKPIIKDNIRFLNLGIFNDKIDYSHQSSYTEKKVTGFLSYQAGMHNFSYEHSLTDVYIHPQSTEKILESGGYSTKSAFKYSFEYDDRDDRVFPTRGKSFRINTELAGLIGTTNHLKVEGNLNLNTKLKNIAIQGILRSGFMSSLSSNPTRIGDRFYLGGPSTFKGHQIRGLGPMFKNDSYGGESYWTASLNTTYPIKKFESAEIYWQSFVQAGNNTLLKDWKGLFGKDSENPIRFSFGAGLALKLMGARLDFSYTFPLTVGKYDKLSPFQIGVSINIL